MKERSTDSIRSQSNVNLKCPENFDPNVTYPALKLCRSPSIFKSGKSSEESGSGRVNLSQVTSEKKKKIGERKFVVAKKKLRKQEVNSSNAAVSCEDCKNATGKSKCLCVAYENLRASHHEFFKNRVENDNEVFDSPILGDGGFDNNVVKVNRQGEITAIANEGKKEGNDASGDGSGENDELWLKMSRDRLLEKARQSVPESGFGRVMHLVKAFEKLRMIQKTGESEVKEAQKAEDDKKKMKWALPGLQQTPKFLTSSCLGLDSGPSYVSDSSQGRISTRISAGGTKSRRSSTESSGTFIRRHWNRKQHKATLQKPFCLTTEQRGRLKEEEFMKKLQKELEEEEKLRIPIAQGLPCTTDEPEIPVKPPAKEITKPVDLVLHSDTRAVERTEFDHQVAMKMKLIEQYRMEMERQRKQAEEEEIRRLRKELVPKAQPMPYFDRPFIPKRSVKQTTIPKEPKFHLPHHKKMKCCLASYDLCTQLD